MAANVEKIIERVQKLLALAGNNANENEALAALEKAHAILAEHNLTMAEIDQTALNAKPSADEVREALNTDTNMPERYNRWVWNAVAKANACMMFSCRPNPKKYATKYTLVGRRINTIVATQMALYLCQTMRRLAQEAAKSAGRSDHAFKNAYLVGMAIRLCERVGEMNRKSGNALVLWSDGEQEKNRDYVANEMGVKFRKNRTPAKIKYDTQGLNRGKADADGVSLSQQVAGRGTRQAALTNT